ncbi:MAG: prephenate dehydrogenase/arogenate dehydrogenase family protein [Lachnospiraceae bacterium]|nr:prephenate dehydrogenase/arogenate dehydrogenase family protein [Lachnospiraceae bacterium]
MEHYPFSDYLFLGFGLIGGSIAKAIRAVQPSARITAYARHKEKLMPALDDHTLDGIADSLLSDLERADVILLCAPTGVNIENLKAIAPYVRKDTLITDVGSVKHDIQESADTLGLSEQFLGGHPMTGKETTGYESADARILENAYYILTPSPKTRQDFTDRFTALVASLHSLVLHADPLYHDYATAAISHVPHLIAAELVGLVEREDNNSQFMKTIAAGGFRDITRIASADPAMWENICRSNTANIRTLLRHYIEGLEHIDSILSEGHFEKIRELFQDSGAYRASLNDRKTTSIDPDYRIFVDIPDETGEIAVIATLLAARSINIKNIGITHNREQAEGALYIAFENETERQTALPILQKYGYRVMSN